MQTNTITRRSALAGTAAACLAGGAIATAKPNPDAEILEAFQTYVAAYRRIDTIQDDKNPTQEAAYRMMYGAEDDVAASFPQTLAGLAAYLKLAFRSIGQSVEADNAVVYGAPMPEDGFNCVGEKMIWSLIGNLECAAEAGHASAWR